MDVRRSSFHLVASLRPLGFSLIHFKSFPYKCRWRNWENAIVSERVWIRAHGMRRTIHDQAGLLALFAGWCECAVPSARGFQRDLQAASRTKFDAPPGPGYMLKIVEHLQFTKQGCWNTGPPPGMSPARSRILSRGLRNGTREISREYTILSLLNLEPFTLYRLWADNFGLQFPGLFNGLVR